MIDETWSEYSEHRSRGDLNELLHYGHSIPVGKGLTQAYVKQHYPGWTWNELIAMLRIGGAVQKTPGGMLRCDPRVQSVRFGQGSMFSVEWDWLAS